MSSIRKVRNTQSDRNLTGYSTASPNPSFSATLAEARLLTQQSQWTIKPRAKHSLTQAATNVA